MLETDVKNLLSLGKSQISVYDVVQVISYLNNFSDRNLDWYTHDVFNKNCLEYTAFGISQYYFYNK